MPRASTAERPDLYSTEESNQQHLRLVAQDGVLLETPALSESQPIADVSDRFKGRVAIEGLEAEYDAITELAELTDGQMLTDLELTFGRDKNDLYGPDGRSLIETAQKGLEAAREQAKKNPDLWFEVGRRSIELEEIIEAVEMVKNFINGTATENTMLLTTNYPWSLKNATEDVGGYNVTRKQSLRRALTVNPDNGKIMLYSQTLDKSNERALAAVDAEFGFEINPDEERLGQRQFVHMSAEEQTEIMTRSVRAYDREMSAQFGGEWYAGRRPADYRNTYDFVRQQRDLIEVYKELKLKDKLTDGVMYNMAATVNARFKAKKEGVISMVPKMEIVNPAQLQQEMEQAGYEARIAGQTFSACGSTFGPGGTEAAMHQAGYGNKACPEVKNGQSVQCPHCKKRVRAIVTKEKIHCSNTECDMVAPGLARKK